MLFLPFGPPASGKSTLARQVEAVFGHGCVVSSDMMRRVLTGDASCQSENEAVFGICRRIILTRLSNGLDVYVDATNLWDTGEFVDVAHKYGHNVVSVLMASSKEEVVFRNSLRSLRVVPSDVIDSMWERWERKLSIGDFPGRVMSVESFRREFLPISVQRSPV